MTRRMSASTLCLLLVLQVFAGCAGMTDQQTSTAVGVGTGAAAGAVIGAILGKKNPAAGAAIGAAGGALIGGLIGWQIGEYRVRQVKGPEVPPRATTAPTEPQRILAKIDDAAAAPQQLKPGDQLVLKAQYTVLAPPEQGQLKVKEVRTIFFNGQRLGRLEKDSALTAGTYESEQQLKIPDDAAEGSYTVSTLVQPVADKAVSDQVTRAFAVGNAPANSAIAGAAAAPVPVRAAAQTSAPAGQRALQTIRAVYNKDVLVNLKDVKVRGAVVLAVVSFTYTGQEVGNYRISNDAGHPSFLMDYGTGRKYEVVSVDGARVGKLAPGDLTEARLTFRAPPDSVGVVSITLGEVGTFDDVKIRP